MLRVAQPLRAAVSSGGVAMAGNSTAVAHTSGTNLYGVQLAQNTSACVATATLATVQAGQTLEEPEPGGITVAPKPDRVEVKTFTANGMPAEQPFDVTASC